MCLLAVMTTMTVAVMMVMTKTVVAAVAAMISEAKKHREKKNEKNSVCRSDAQFRVENMVFIERCCSLSHRTVWQTRKYADYARDVPKRYWLCAVYAYESELSGCSTNEYRNRDIFIALSSCLSASGYQGVHLTLAHTEFAWMFRMPHSDLTLFAAIPLH